MLISKQDNTWQHRTARRSSKREAAERRPVRVRGARYRYMTFDDRQQAGQRGAAKEVIFPGFRPDGNGERRAVFTVCEFQNRTSQKSWET